MVVKSLTEEVVGVIRRERRKFARHSVLIDAHISVLVGAGSNIFLRIPVKIHSISRNGARLHVPKWTTYYVRPGRVTNLTILHRSLKETEIRGKVVWMKDTELAVAFVGRSNKANPQTGGSGAWTESSRNAASHSELIR